MSTCYPSHAVAKAGLVFWLVLAAVVVAGAASIWLWAIGVSAVVVLVGCIALITVVGCGTAASREVEAGGDGDMGSVVAVVKADGLGSFLRIRGLEGECVGRLESIVLAARAAIRVVGALLIVFTGLVVVAGIVMLLRMEVSWCEPDLLVVAVSRAGWWNEAIIGVVPRDWRE